MKHATTAELNRRIRVITDERDATHAAMIGPDLTALLDPLGDEWACLSQRYDALADEGVRLYAELVRRNA